ncbi:peptidoglycan-binding protein [Streptomyces sp. NBC_00378]|uniref:L,D-transpeptidase family protein n=1 Tax=unclassified Streptomyces TaxID=2593676 RepID=UPI0022558AB8|nr:MULTISPECIES: peptidoglycan-binding protein [unclassified Streptomyces]MCX5115389.1 peptidoglycan-binding protein [Streptomyces sp. NBC_00378]MCX5115464.1 peptidoglycan-binding protein [Streptomyces sp. NBC_00378]
MNRSTLWATLTTTALAIAAFATLGTQAPDTASANSSDPAASAARSAAPASRNQQQWPTLRTGAQGSAVTTLQQLLTAQGHPLTADGEFGPLTEAAVRAFQAQHSLQADGVVGPKTWNALTTTLRTGAQGSAVTALQQLLTARGHSLTADGAFGGLTAAAVQAFQKNQGLQADGVAGPATWNALITAPTGARPDTGQTAQPGPTGYSLKFTKNQNHPMYSTLALVHNGKAVKTYRAGSGMGVTNECASGEGWLPSGTYQVKAHERDRNSGLQTGIKGYAIQLADKTCTPKAGQKPVKRDALFIHSEMLSDGTQAIDVPLMDDDYYRWDGDIDYQSWGCIKITPADIKDLFTRLDRAGWPKNLTLQVS